MVVKVAGVALGIGLIGAGGIAVAKPHWLGMDYMPTFHALSKDSDFGSSVYTSETLGHKFKNYLVGVTNKKESTNKNNQFWWEWSFRQLKKDSTVKGKFSTITADYETSGSVSLNQVCKEAYKKSESDLKGDVDSAQITESEFKKSDFWKYCSPLGKKPEKVGDGKYQSQIGSTQDANFASVDKGVNEMFWTIREKEIRGNDDNFEKITIAEADSHTYFKDTSKNLRELCEDAYQKSTTGGDSSQTNPTADTTKKYCAINIPQS